MFDPNDYIPDWTEDDVTRHYLDEREEEPIDRYNQEPDEDLYKDC